MINIARIIALLATSAFFLPAFNFCPFRLPYLYCFICPRPCHWHKLRGVVLLVALALNLRKYSFCNYLCPFGAVQKLLFMIKGKKVRLAPGFKYIKFVSLILLALVIWLTRQEILLAIKVRTLLWLAFLIGISAACFSYRFFCFHLCPVNTLGKLSFWRPLKKKDGYG